MNLSKIETNRMYKRSTLISFGYKSKIVYMISILNVMFAWTLSEPKITLSMIMKNEAGRYLKPVLESVRQYIDNAVIIDDASTDDSVAVVKEILSGMPLKIIVNIESKFHNEVELRKQQWNETIATNPEWILCLDADEVFEDAFKDQIRRLIKKDPWVDAWLFRLYDFWDETHFREDTYWFAHYFHRIFLVRFNHSIAYTWNEQAHHCGRLPKEVGSFAGKQCDLRLKHLGWAKKTDRIAKYDRYKRLDPDARFGWKEQYESILDEHPRLVEWHE